MTAELADPRTIALVTGAYGGMGRPCARLLGQRHRLALCDIDPVRLNAFADDLRGDGFDVAVVQAGSIAEPSVLAQLTGAIKAEGMIGAIAHTAGLSPALSTWRPILDVNLVGTGLLLDAVTDLLAVGAGTVVIGSMAAHTAVQDPDIDALIDNPLGQGFLDTMEPIVKRLSDGSERSISTVAYGLSKRGVLRMCQRRALEWGRIGARVTTVSPGMIATPMGRQEANADARVQGLVDKVPVGRWGGALDIANAVDFLVSDAASYITGCDLRVDGGITPLIRGPVAY